MSQTIQTQQPIPNNKNFSPWLNIHIEAYKDHKDIRTYIQDKNYISDKDNTTNVTISIARAIERDMKEKVTKTYELTKYEYASMSQEDILKANLTQKQIEIASLRQYLSCKEIATKLSISPKTVYETYTNAIYKIKKYRDKLNNDTPLELSEQQVQINNLQKQGLNAKQISQQLNISTNTVYVQKSRIKKILTKQ